jgi:RND family efflux transporter MFP subunit
VKKRLLVALAAIAALAIGGVWVWKSEKQPSTAASGGTAPAVQRAQRLGTVELRDVADVYVADAVIEAVRSATVSAQIAGNVTRFYVDAGDRVRRGQLLVTIDTREADARLAAGGARVAQAQAQLGQAKLNYERTAKLLERKFVAQAALDKAAAELESAQAELKAAQAGESVAATARSFAEVRSPIDGVVTRRLAELGELAAPGRALLEVHDPSALRAVASVPQFVLRRVVQAQSAEVVLPTQNGSVRATHVVVLPAADARLLSTQVRADLPAELPAEVVPGTAAKVLLPVGRVSRLVAPEDAIVRRGELTAAYVVGVDGEARLRQVRIGEPVAGGWVEVLAGLDAGERVRLP